MDHEVFPPATAAMSARRKALAPDTHDAFTAFSKQVFADGALPEVTKQLIAVAVAHYPGPLLHPRTHQARAPERCE
jgi:alkylhydroperoxidase/carboxymuconolactone decarboxylase family protein YurZ